MPQMGPRKSAELLVWDHRKPQILWGGLEPRSEFFPCRLQKAGANRNVNLHSNDNVNTDNNHTIIVIYALIYEHK